ncbi:MAG: hypothetical protein ACOC4M_08835, partial [Promethearchaeia archaeon]
FFSEVTPVPNDLAANLSFGRFGVSVILFLFEIIKYNHQLIHQLVLTSSIHLLGNGSAFFNVLFWLLAFYLILPHKKAIYHPNN